MGGIAVDVKNEIVTKVKSGEKVTELSKLYGVSDKTIYNWLRQKVEGSISLIEHSKVKKKNGQLKQIIGVLTLELEKTKKKRRDIFVLVKEKLPFLPNMLLASVFGFVRRSG